MRHDSLAARKREMAKARKALERITHRLNYLESTLHYKVLTDEQCTRRRLCHTSCDGGKRRCGKKAYAHYPGNLGRTLYLCEDCYYLMGMGLQMELKIKVIREEEDVSQAQNPATA